jgi:hypothetical protein
MKGEMPVFSFRGVVEISVSAPETPANNLASVGFGTTALAMETRLLSRLAQACEVDLDGVGLDFRHWSLLIGGVFRAVPQLNWAIAVVMSFHGKIADANAVFIAALVLVPGYTAIMLVHFSIPPAVASCWVMRFEVEERHPERSSTPDLTSQKANRRRKSL